MNDNLKRHIFFLDIFNTDTLNIFTDASIYKYPDGFTVSAPGCECVANDGEKNVLLDSCYDLNNLVYGSTNNDGEIRAIYLGVLYALKYKDYFKYINLFSDSNLCIQTLTNWIYTWCLSKDANGIIYTGGGTPVMNQSVIVSIIDTIVHFGLSINFYHQKGHVNMSAASLQKAYDDFIKTNKLQRYNVDREFIKTISFHNDSVDVKTKEMLEHKKEVNIPVKRPIQFRFNDTDMKQYKNLTKRRI